METKTNMVISRSYGEKHTSGCLHVFDGDRSVFNCKTLELPDFNNAKNISCILPGVYDVEKYTRPTGQVVFLLKNVPSRTNVEIHPGNYVSGKKIDTEGCILPGLRFVDINGDGNLDIADSTKAMNILLSLMPEKFKLYIL
jgi:hypothetical protein